MSTAYFDKKGTFHGTIEDLQEKILESIESWSTEEMEQFRRDVVRAMNKGKSATGEWVQ